MGLAFKRVNDWRSRWVNIPKSRTIHRVRALASSRKAWKDFPSGEGVTVCGKEGKMWMPGILSRMAAPRCRKCCELLGIPSGVGAPYNDPTLFPPEGKAICAS